MPPLPKPDHGLTYRGNGHLFMLQPSDNARRRSDRRGRTGAAAGKIPA